MCDYEVAITIIGKLYDTSLDLIITILEEKYSMTRGSGGSMWLTTGDEDTFNQIAQDIRDKAYAPRPSILIIDFYGDYKAFSIPLEANVC